MATQIIRLLVHVIPIPHILHLSIMGLGQGSVFLYNKFSFVRTHTMGILVVYHFYKTKLVFEIQVACWNFNFASCLIQYQFCRHQTVPCSHECYALVSENCTGHVQGPKYIGRKITDNFKRKYDCHVVLFSSLTKTCYMWYVILVIGKLWLPAVLCFTTLVFCVLSLNNTLTDNSEAHGYICNTKW